MTIDDTLFTKTQRNALRKLIRLTGERSEIEVESEREYASAVRRCTDEYETRRTTTEEKHEAEKQAAEVDYERRRGELVTRFEREYAEIKQVYEVELATIQEKAEHSDTEARKQMDEAIWVAETVFEATEDRPQEEYDQTIRVLDARREEIDETRESAVAYLKQCRLTAAMRGEDAAGWIDAESGRARLEAAATDASERLDALRAMRLPRWFIGPRLPLVIIVLAGIAGVIAGWQAAWSMQWFVWAAPVGVVVLGILGGIGMHAMARKQVQPVWAGLEASVVAGREGYDLGLSQAAGAREAMENERIETRRLDTAAAHEKYEPILGEIETRKQHHLERINEKYPALMKSTREQNEKDLHELEQTFRNRLAEANRLYSTESRQAREQLTDGQTSAKTHYDRVWQQLETNWKDGMAEVREAITQIKEENERLFLPLNDTTAWDAWAPPMSIVSSIRFGRLGVDMNRVPGGLPEDDRLRLEFPSSFELPAVMSLSERCSMLVEIGDDGGESAVEILRTAMFRLLTTLPPGKVRFTIIDPVGLGQNFAGFMHLADYLEALVTDRIWTETRHIEQRLVDLTDHMENVIQKYLRNEYETIAEYNEHAGEIAEPFRFLVIANFPANISDAAARRLASVISSGPRCGVYTLITFDPRQVMPKGIDGADLRRSSIHLVPDKDRYLWKDEDYGDLPLTLDARPSDHLLTRCLHQVGEAAKDSSRVEVPFSMVAPPDGGMWTGSTASSLEIPLGRAGATKLQHMLLGRGTSQHVLIAGKTGSGKSTLLHVLITNLALWFSPDEVQLYLVDFKKGVEFKAYAAHELPHARAVAIESDREFGLSVLQRLDEELKRRGEKFRELGVQDLAGFRACDTGEAMPRTLLVIDEFQEFFTDDDRVGQEASLLLDRLVRQGRAFGIHVVLGSQTLGGAYSLAKSTLGQMAVRIALQCSEQDAYMIMSDDNSAARLLARPGEAIYNDASGLIEGNSPFQIVWLPDEERDATLAHIAATAKERGYEPPSPQIVFEGNAPADIRGNHLLARLITSPPSEPPLASRAWLGGAVAIKDPTCATFRRQTGANLLIVGQRDEAALSMLTVTMTSLAAQWNNDGQRARFIVLDGTPADARLAGYLDEVAEVLPHDASRPGWRDVASTIEEVAKLVEDRQAAADDSTSPPVFIVIHALQRFRDLRQSDEFGFSMDDGPAKPDKLFQTILVDGPMVGVHTIAWCDTMTNVERSLDRRSLREFEMRVAFQMSATDSSSLLDNPMASRLGLHHAMLHNEEQGILEKFRPYALPSSDWLQDVGRQLRGEHSADPVGKE